MPRKISFKEIKKIVENLGYILIEYKCSTKKMILKDKDGFYYEILKFGLESGKKPLKFHESNKFTIDNIKLWLKINYPHLELVSKEFINSKLNLIFKDTCGYYYSTTLNRLKHYHPKRFEKSNPYTINNIKTWCKINNKSFELLSDNYQGNNTNLLWKCLINNCAEEFYSTWANIYKGEGCPFCSGHKLGLSNCLATRNPELSKEWHKTKNKNLTPYDVGYRVSTKVWWICKECGYEWESYISNRSRFGCGCPQCIQSKGEKRIKELLRRNRMLFFTQKEFDTLIGLGKGNLSYDFYLPDINLLIEYQGQQHEKYIKGFHKSKKDFERQLEHDKRKREYSEKNGIKLLEIWYWDYDNIEQILNEYLKLKEVV